MNDAKQIAQETAALLRIADNEREYREHVLVTLARLEVKVDSLQESFKEHEDLDERRHTAVTQRIGDNSSTISKGAGIIIAIVAMLGFIMWVIDQVKT